MLSDWKYKMMVGESKWKLNTLENGNRNYVQKWAKHHVVYENTLIAMLVYVSTEFSQ